jgi:rod shape determining protein RodA
MQGTQSQLNFLPEKHTDFIFTTFAEEFGFLGGIILLLLYLLIIFFCYLTAMQNHNRFSALLTLGIAATFFFYFSVNMLMVMGLAPVVGVPFTTCQLRWFSNACIAWRFWLSSKCTYT